MSKDPTKPKLSRKMQKAMKAREKAERKKAKSVNREFTVVAYLFFFLFLCMAGYFCYFLLFQSESFINSPYNPRLSAITTQNIRGDIISTDGEVLATTKTREDGSEYRVYPHGREYAHVVGFEYGSKAGVEKDANFKLLRSHDFIVTRVMNEILEEKNIGDTAVITVDSRLQDVAYNGISGNKGAVIALEPSTGKVLCMVSLPDFDPNTISENWDAIVSDDSSTVLLNRTTQGLYPPGSTFKILTALEYLLEGGSPEDPFNCEGEYTKDGTTIHCYRGTVHGQQTFKEAFGNSCNSTFSQVGLTLDLDSFSDLSRRLLFDTKLPTRLSPVNKSQMKLSSSSDTGMIMQTAIGQGETLVTPLHLAMISSAIANDGVLKEPYVIERIQSAAGALVSPTFQKTYGSLLSGEEAEMMRDFMRQVVTGGTGAELMSDTYTAYGKTGTAEYSSNKAEDHSWFTGFAENGEKQIAIAVIIEGNGSGAQRSLPVVRSIFDAYFSY